MSPLNNPTLQMLASSIIFGLGAVFVLFIQFDAVVIAFYRLLIGIVLFGGILLYQRQSFAINVRALLFAALAGAMLGLDLGLWNQSIRFVGPGIATILNSLQVFFMAGFGILIYRNKPHLLLWISLFVSFIGIVLLCSNEWHVNQHGAIGIITGIASAVAFALSMLSMRETAKHQKNGLMNTMFYASIGGTVAVGLFVALSGRSFLPDAVSSWGYMLIYAVIVHVVAWYLMAKALPQLNIAIIGLLACVEPIAAALIDVAFLGKTLTAWQFLGATLTILAIYIGSQEKKQRTS